MDFARSRPDTGIGDRGSGTALLSVPAGTAARRDRHGNHSRLPAWHGNGGKGVCRGFQGAFLCGGGCGELLPVLPGLVLLLCAGETASGGAPPRHPGAATRARTGPRSREARQRPAVRTGKRWKTVLLPPRTRKPRWRRYVAHGTSHQDPRQEGCRGRRKAIKERAPAPTATGPLAGQISVLSRRSTVCCGAADAATQIRRQ